jgi:hypothetical protein
MIGWILILVFLLVSAALAWYGAGFALPPATDVQTLPPEVDGDGIADDLTESTEAIWRPDEGAGHTDLAMAPCGPPMRKAYTGRIASDHMYTRPPLLETVRVRAFILEVLILAVCALVYFGLNLEPIGRLQDIVVELPLVSAVIATLAFLIALLVGAFRQISGFLLSRAAALPMIDEAGNPRFAYLGDVPPNSWQYSPWFRAGTWSLVSGCSLIGALIGAAALIQPMVDEFFVRAVIGLLVLRWLISWLPKHLMKRAIDRDAAAEGDSG